MKTIEVINKKKVCISCGNKKTISEFGKLKNSKDGFNYYCKECRNKVRIKRYLKNKSYENTKSKEWYQNNTEKVKLYSKDYKKNNTRYKEKRNEYRRKKRNSNPLYKLTHNIRALIGCSFKNNGYKKESKTQQILGCSFEELKIHIKEQFEPWMTWENHGKCNGLKNSKWNLDHIIPIASAKTPEDVIRLNHYTNFQPLCSYINQVMKKDKVNYK